MLYPPASHQLEEKGRKRGGEEREREGKVGRVRGRFRKTKREEDAGDWEIQ
jgi:hypothetical protein